MSVEIISFPNGRRKLIYENYVYVKQKHLNGGKIVWECCYRRTEKSCKAKVQTRDGVFLRSTNTHTCAAFGHPEKIEIMKARAQMLTQANESDDRTHAIIGANTQAMSDNVKAFLPNIETMKRGIRRMREAGNLPAPARDDGNFEIPHD